MDTNYIGPQQREDLLREIFRFYEERFGGPRLNNGMDRTPQRWDKAMVEMTSGYGREDDLEYILTTFDSEGADQMIVQQNIPIYSLCEHHILPFSGYAHIGYIPRNKIVGLSKFKRVVDVFAKRFQIQERLTRQIADALEQHLNPRGVIVTVEAEHFCMTMRGVQTPGTLTTTSAVTGVFADVAEGSRQEFEAILQRGRNGR